MKTYISFTIVQCTYNFVTFVNNSHIHTFARFFMVLNGYQSDPNCPGGLS